MKNKKVHLSLLLICIFLFFSVNFSYSQKKTGNSNTEFISGDEDVSVDKMAEFPGGRRALLEYLRVSIEYPHSAQRDKLEGRVLLRFTVGPDGKIRHPSVIWGVSQDLDKEALRVVLEMPDWIPGEQRGKKVNVNYTMPINFKLKVETNLYGRREIPKFAGGDKELFNYIKQNLVYPQSAQDKNIEGVVFVQFTINRKGGIIKVSPLVKLDSDLDKEAVRLVKQMPKWEPGKLNGELTSVRYVLPIVFEIRE